MQHQKRVIGFLACSVALAAASGGWKVYAGENEKGKGEAAETKVALPAEQIIASIRTAVAAKPGRVLEFEAEIEDGKTHCDVKVLAADGKTYEVEVDVASNKATEVELADEAGEDDGDKN